MERWRLDNKIALVTGGSKGIGKAIVDEFLQLGAAVVTVARNADTLAESIRPVRVLQASAVGISERV